MRVHLLNTDLEIGGTPRVVKELAIRLRPMGFETRVACLAPWGPVADELQDAGVPVTAFDAVRPGQLPATVGRVRRWADGADVLLSFLMHANIVASLARSGPTRLLQSVQTTQPYPRWHWWLQAMANAAAECVITPTADAAAMAGRLHPPHRTRVIPNAVDLRPSAAATTRADGRFRVGFIGRLDRVKCVPDLVAAIGRLPGTELHVYGEGADRPAIVDAIATCGVGDRVTLHGRVATADVALAEIDLLVLPSLAEGFGLVLIEAMAAGVPVVATNVPGIRDVVTHGQTGLLVPPQNPDALAAGIDRLQRDPALRATLAANARATVERRYTWNAVLPQYARVLRGDYRADTQS